MMKKLALRLAVLAAVVFSLYSCVRDSFDREDHPQVSTFNVFQKSANGRDPDYAKGFALLYKKYAKLNPEFSETQKRNKTENGAYMYLYISSQMFTQEDGSKTVLFPIIKENKVAGIAAGILNKEENYVSYHILSGDTEGYQNILNAFASRFNSKSSSSAAKTDGDECGDDGTLCENIDTIFITPPPKKVKSVGANNDGTDNNHNPWNDNPGGGCGGFGDCNGGGGSSGPQTPQQNQDPCQKIKQKQNNAKYAAKFNALNKPEIFNMDKERGFYEKQPPKGVNVESGFVQVDGPPGSTGLDLPDDTSGISGLFHSHNNVDGSIKIFSPTDVITFINIFLKNAREYAGGYGDAYSTVVTSAGSYTIKYTGTAHPGGVDYHTGKTWDKWYEEKMSAIEDSNGDIPQDKVEAVFTKFLQEVVNKPGLEVFKVTANTATKMTYNPITKTADKVDCPQ